MLNAIDTEAVRSLKHVPVGFIEDDDLVRRTRVLRVRFGSTRGLASGVLDLLAYNADASLVGRVQFKDTISEVFWAIMEESERRRKKKAFSATYPNS